MLSLKIKELRENQGLSQSDLARKAGVHVSYIGQIESNKVTPSLKTLIKIAAALNISPGYLLENEQMQKTVVLENFSEYLTEEDKDLIAQKRPWITLIKELDEDFTPEQVRQIMDTYKNVLKNNNK